MNVAAYCRVSTDDEEQQSSYESQIDHYTEKISQNSKWRLVEIFADEGLSGTSTKKRSEFLRMINMCRRKKIDLILTKSISRFARNTVDCLNNVRELKALGIYVIFEKENINTSDTEMGELMLTLMSCFAQAESESISKNVSWGIRQSFKSGKVPIRYSHLLGYERGTDNKPKIIPEQAETVRLIFNRYLDGFSLQNIADKLSAENHKNIFGKIEWSATAIKRILENEKYCGCALLQKTYILDCISKKAKKNNGELPMYFVSNNHEAIVSKETFDRAQEETARRISKKKNATKFNKSEQGKYSAKYALSELLVCGECGTAYSRVTWTSKGFKEHKWRCSNRLQNGKNIANIRLR